MSTKQFKSKSKGFKPSMKGKQGRKDSRSPRINLDNERISTVEKDIERGSKQCGANDITTWNKNGELLKSACSYPFSSIVGDSIGATSVPGVMTFTYSPAISAGVNPIAANKAFQALYSDLVHANSRNYKYEYTDLAMFIMGGNEVFAALAEPMRIFGLYKAYQEPNRYYVDALVSSLGWDPADTRRHLSDIWYGVNELIIQTRQIWIPNTIPVLNRWIDMNTHVYKDAEGQRAQTYAFRRARYWMLSETASDQGTMLVPAVFNNNATYDDVSDSVGPESWYEFDRIAKTTQGNSSAKMTWPKFKSMVQKMINSLVASGDRGSIYGDMYAAFGENKLYAMPDFPGDFKVFPEYNAEILSQIENIEITPYFQRAIAQDNGQLDIASPLRIVPVWYINQGSTTAPYKVPVVGSGVTNGYTNWKDLAAVKGPAYSHLVNSHLSGQPTPEMVMILTRFKPGAVVPSAQYMLPANWVVDANSGQYPVGSKLTTNSLGAAPSSCSTEMVHDIKYTIFTNNGISWQGSINQWNVIDDASSWDDAETVSFDNSDMMAMAFDWHPFSTIVLQNWLNDDASVLPTSNRYSHNFIYAYGDYDNYTQMDDVNLRKIHEVAQYSAWGVPQVISR